MKYFNLLQQHEKDFINSLQKECSFTLQNEFQADFATIKAALKDKFGPLKTTLDLTNLGTLQAQVNKVKEMYQYLQSIENQRMQERDTYVQGIEQDLANW